MILIPQLNKVLQINKVPHTLESPNYIQILTSAVFKMKQRYRSNLRRHNSGAQLICSVFQLAFLAICHKNPSLHVYRCYIPQQSFPSTSHIINQSLATSFQQLHLLSKHLVQVKFYRDLTISTIYTLPVTSLQELSNNRHLISPQDPNFQLSVLCKIKIK